MSDVPQIVRDRLKTASVAEHPDANLLTAFAENSLSAREHSTILDHLSRCADCRDVVALALPATDDVQVSLTPKRISWLTWPALRWGLVAAGVVAIGSFGIVRYQHETGLQTASLKSVATEARNETLPTSAPASETDKSAQQQVPAPNAVPAASREHKSEHAASLDAKRTLLTNSTIGGSLRDQQSQALLQTQPPVSATPAFTKETAPSMDLRVPAANQTMQVNGANLQVETSQNQPVAARADDSSELIVAKSKPAETAQAGNAGGATAAPASPSPPPAPMGGPLGEKRFRVLPPSALAPARWIISGNGSLQRSQDQGQTWQDVNVVANAASADSFLFAQSTAEASARQSNKQALKKDAAAPQVFRTVTANGYDVWAGGSNGMLYHSVDNGNHWTRVVPTVTGVALTGDVVSLDFPDPQHGKVTTSTPEVWTTSDAGQSWQKQ